MRVRLSQSASNYLRKEVDYLRSRNPAAALRFVERIGEAKRKLQRFPELGSEERKLPIAGARTWVLGDYLMYYVIHDGMVEIVTIRSGHMKPPAFDLQMDDDIFDDP